MSKQSDIERQQAIERLQHVQVGDTIYFIMLHRSRSGMQRVVRMIHFPNNDASAPMWISYNAAKAIGARYDRNRQGIVVNGCGFDVAQHILEQLEMALFGCTGKLILQFSRWL
jgi:hypothetical protein